MASSPLQPRSWVRNALLHSTFQLLTFARQGLFFVKDMWPFHQQGKYFAIWSWTFVVSVRTSPLIEIRLIHAKGPCSAAISQSLSVRFSIRGSLPTPPSPHSI